MVIVNRIQTSEVDVTSLKHAVKDARKAQVELTIVALRGPSGWPLVRIKGQMDRVKQLLLKWGYSDEDNS